MKLPLATGFLSRAPAAVGGNRGDSGRYRVRPDCMLDPVADSPDADAALDPVTLRADDEPLVLPELSPPPPPISQASL